MKSVMRAIALDAEGNRPTARLFWYGAAVEWINEARLFFGEDEDESRFAAVGEAVAALANVLRPLTKEQTRAVVDQFLSTVRRS